jgi:D-proline reductase (dithiol) PrdB
MAQLSDLKLSHRLYLSTYRWRSMEPVPRAALSKPVVQSRVALVTSAGLVRPGDQPFDEDFKGGDFSYRILPADTEVAGLREYHKSDAFDHRGIEADRNVGFPLDRLRELAAEGTIGEVAPRHISLMGSITAPGRLQRDTAPEVAEILRRDEVDVALLVPV